MNVRDVGLMCVVWVSLCGAIAVAGQPASPLEVGLAARDITPEVGYGIGGYGNTSTGIRHRLHAKAVVFRQGEESAALIVCDVQNVARELVTRIRSRVAEETGLAPERIGVAATHTHTGPDYFAEIRRYAEAERAGDVPDALREGYVAQLIEQAAEAAIEAHAAAEAVSLDVVRAEVAGVSFNRRYLMRDGRVRFNPGRRNPDVVRPVGPIDPELLTLVFRDGNGEAIGGLSNFANHVATASGRAYSADYPHYLEQVLREELGEDFLSVFGIGACGDVNHIDVMGTASEAPTTRSIGQALGEAVLSNVDAAAEQSPGLGFASQTLFLPMHDYTEQELTWAVDYAAGERRALYPGRQFLQTIRARTILSLYGARHGTAVPPGASEEPAGLPVMRSTPGRAVAPSASGEPWRLPVEIQAIRLSADTAIVTMPGEIFVELGLAIKRRSPFRHTLVMELTNGRIAYVPTRQAFREGDYEPLNSRLAPGSGEAMVDASVELLQTLHGQP